MIKTTPLETGLLLFMFLMVCGIIVFSSFIPKPALPTTYYQSPTQDEVIDRIAIQVKWDEMIIAIQEEDEERIKELGKWLDQHAGTTFEKLEDAKAKLICAWCGEVIGEANTSEDTHGICKSCKGKYFPSEE